MKIPQKLIGFCASAAFVAWSPFGQADPVVDVLVLYIDAAEQTASGRDINARVASYIEYSNQAFENSNVDMRFSLVGTERVALDYTYVNSENLGALRSNSTVARLRQEYGADLVTLLNLRRPMSGGYVCGIGYVPYGDAGTGRLASNAGSAAFSLVGVDCGLSTFAHELGHNMSLGHSYLQNSEGGVWSWARGHGVQGLFSTVMAYPQSYGTRNQVQVFSNPQVNICSGQPCGEDRNQSQGADASRSLNNLGEQIAGFMPSVTSIDQPDPVLPPCTKSDLEGNLITNGEFDSLEGWKSLFEVSRLTQVDHQTDCVDQVLTVTDRTETHSDAYQDLSGQLEQGKEYTFSGKFSVAGTERDTVHIALRLQDDEGVHYQYLEPISATANEMTAYSERFRVDADAQPHSIGLLIYGPQPGVDILADELALLETPVSEPEPGNQIVLHERFELEATGWSSYGGSRAAFSSHAFAGDYSLRSYSRRYSYSGPMREVTGLFEAGTRYGISASVYINASSASSANAAVWVYYVDDEGAHWEQVLSTSVSTNGWQTIEGNFAISAVGEVTQMRLLLGGPNPSFDLYIDELMVRRQ